MWAACLGWDVSEVIVDIGGLGRHLDLLDEERDVAARACALLSDLVQVAQADPVADVAGLRRQLAALEGEVHAIDERRQVLEDARHDFGAWKDEATASEADFCDMLRRQEG